MLPITAHGLQGGVSFRMKKYGLTFGEQIVPQKDGQTSFSCTD